DRKHTSQGRIMFRNSKSQETQRSLDEDGTAELGSHQDDERANRIWQYMTESDPRMANSQCPCRLDISELANRDDARADHTLRPRYDGHRDGHNDVFDRRSKSSGHHQR